jgi:hypothetical protein
MPLTDLHACLLATGPAARTAVPGYRPGTYTGATRRPERDDGAVTSFAPEPQRSGRVLTDDVFSARFAWPTHGKITSDGLKPHDDLLAELPYLVPPDLY